MYEPEILEMFREIPVFSLSDANQVIPNRIYAKKFLKRLKEMGKLLKIKRGLYTLHKDSFLVSTFIKKPSYITGVSALQFHRVITQIPKEVFCATTKKSSDIKFIDKISFIKTKYFFGYVLEDYEGFKIPIADREKAIIDSIGKIPIHVIEEAFDEVDENKMIGYLLKIKKSEILKRMGYLMEKHQNKPIYGGIKKYLNYKYIFLDPLGPKKGKKDKKWGLIINI
ncbi:hypothetical protein HYT23_06510 [Candidatus Pacearchaeota archaeon]|nr:hypothetical protein [Candidatus Pacearchaeota archaeon]